MATSGNWSVVGKQKKGKPQSQQQQQLSKQQKKQFIESMPRIEAAGRLQVTAFAKRSMFQVYVIFMGGCICSWNGLVQL